MAVCNLYLTVHVLSVWMVTCLSVKVKDASRSIPIQHKLLNLNFSTRCTATGLAGVFDSPCYFPKWIDEDFTVCGDGYCRCRDTVADCSKHYGKLTYVPSLPAGISTVVFTHNRLVNISRDDFFINITNVTDLDLSSNFLTRISPGVFRPFTNLTALRLVFNNLTTYTILAPVLSVTTLTLLDLSLNPLLGPPPDGIFHTNPLLQLESLGLNYNGIVSLNMTVFKPLVRLNYLQLADNKLSRDSLHEDYLPQLTDGLALSSNPFHFYPETCRGEDSFFPNLTWLDMSRTSVYGFFPTKVCLPRLETFSAMNADLIYMKKDAFSHAMFPSLKLIGLRYGFFTKAREIQGNAFRNPQLQYIDLSFSSINFASDTVDADCFAGCPKLEGLWLDGNDFSDVTEEKFNRLFSQVSILSWLSLESTHISRISAGMFTNMRNLAFLALGSNKLSDIPDGVFDALPNLQELDLSKNQISVVRETTFSTATRQRLRHLDLSGNPFLCSCELMWFRQWLTTQPALFSNCSVFDLLHHRPCYTYTCDNLLNVTVQSFYVADQTCLWRPGVSKYIIATVVILLLVFFLVTFLYRYRWHIRLLLYEAYRGRGDRWRRLQERHFRYDVFVCYDSADLNWVREHLMPELEGRLGLRLCIHQRDFTPGAPIVQNIEESVENSKKVMMIFSKKFAESHWCQFELQLSLSHVMENDDELLVVFLEDIPSRDLTPAMMAVMRTMTYIEWEDEPEARASFWGRLRIALNEILPARD